MRSLCFVVVMASLAGIVGDVPAAAPESTASRALSTPALSESARPLT